MVVDSIQTVFSLKLQSAPGSIGQVREAATQLLFAAKGHNVPIFLVGHVTKDGSLAGPKALEHVVDTVLYFEGERHHAHRVVRAVKNRFGAVSELGVFEMTGAGLRAVPNPSQLFLAERPAGTPGSAVLCCMEGSRPLLVEVQALVSSSTFGNARRMTSGIDPGRLALLLAVLEKRAGLNLMGEDVFVNIAGGMTVDEPASDLSIAAAVASSLRNRPVVADTAVFGEIGLAGEVRGASQAPLRVREAAQLGFKRCVLPRANLDPADRTLGTGGCELVPVSTLGEALDALILVIATHSVFPPARHATAGVGHTWDWSHPMAWFVLARVLFLAAVTGAAMFLQPLTAPLMFNAGFGLLLGALVIVFEWRVRDLSVTHMLGALLGGRARSRARAACSWPRSSGPTPPSRASPSCTRSWCWC